MLMLYLIDLLISMDKICVAKSGHFKKISKRNENSNPQIKHKQASASTPVRGAISCIVCLSNSHN